ncbi:transporter [Lithospermum erythrorhizon]|uniref:Transporter n=1 Tax=Lithospermum erythrorhizon TaxID=34254 RepID=A0AAV3RKJ5_LITER
MHWIVQSTLEEQPVEQIYVISILLGVFEWLLTFHQCLVNGIFCNRCFYMALVGYLTRIFAIVLVGRLFKMTFRDSLALALIMSKRGQVELILFVHWMDFKMIEQPHFSMFVLLTVVVAAIATPKINLVYDPTKPYMIDTRRNIQHTAINADCSLYL